VFYFAAQCSAVILFCWFQCSSPWLVWFMFCLLVWYKYWFYPGKWRICFIEYHFVHVHFCETSTGKLLLFLSEDLDFTLKYTYW